MRLLQIAFVAVLGSICTATFVTSETLHAPCATSAQMITPAPTQD